MTTQTKRLPVSIRRARMNELALLRHLHISYLWCIGMKGSALDQVDAYIRALPGIDAALIRNGTYCIAECDGVVVGAGGWSAAPDVIRATAADDRSPERGVAFIRAAFAVELGIAGQGLEREMIEQAESAAADAGYVIAEAHVPDGCANIYRALGYREVRSLTLTTARGDVVTVAVMRRAISTALAAVA